MFVVVHRVCHVYIKQQLQWMCTPDIESGELLLIYSCPDALKMKEINKLSQNPWTARGGYRVGGRDRQLENPQCEQSLPSQSVNASLHCR